MNGHDSTRYAWLWDTPLSNADFDSILRGERRAGAYDREWAVLRLIEYAPYREIRRLLTDAAILELWPSLADKVRSVSRRQGMEFLHEWLTRRAA